MKKIIYCFFASLLLSPREVKVNTPTAEGSGGENSKWYPVKGKMV